MAVEACKTFFSNAWGLGKNEFFNFSAGLAGKVGLAAIASFTIYSAYNTRKTTQPLKNKILKVIKDLGKSTLVAYVAKKVLTLTTGNLYLQIGTLSLATLGTLVYYQIGKSKEPASE